MHNFQVFKNYNIYNDSKLHKLSHCNICAQYLANVLTKCTNCFYLSKQFNLYNLHIRSRMQTRKCVKKQTFRGRLRKDGK